MKFGFIPIEGLRYAKEAIEEVACGEELGFSSVFIQERHLIKDYYWPSPLGTAAQFVAHTSRIKIGTAIMILPWLNTVTEWPLIRDVVIAETSSQALEIARRYLHSFYQKAYAESWKHQFIPEDIASDFDRLKEDRFIIGDPDEVIAGIRYFEEKYGSDHLICRFSFGEMPHERIVRELKLFSKYVIPAWDK